MLTSLRLERSRRSSQPNRLKALKRQEPARVLKLEVMLFSNHNRRRSAPALALLSIQSHNGCHKTGMASRELVRSFCSRYVERLFFIDDCLKKKKTHLRLFLLYKSGDLHFFLHKCDTF